MKGFFMFLKNKNRNNLFLLLVSFLALVTGLFSGLQEEKSQKIPEKVKPGL